MGEIEKTIDVFEKIRKYQYKITIDNGLEILLKFSRESYHHLAGFQHLSDMPDIANPYSKQKFYNDLRKGNISSDRIKKSSKYADIYERITFFQMLEEILSPGAGKIIVEFDKSRTNTEIVAKFCLFRREGNPFKEQAVYFTLFIDCKNSTYYYPVTYIVEHSNMYVREQTMYECKIERIPIGTKKIPVGV